MVCLDRGVRWAFGWLAGQRRGIGLAQAISGNRERDPGVIGIDQADLPPFEQGPIDLKAAWFSDADHQRPLELEIGSGKGTFLVQHAAEVPQVNFIGIEYVRAYWLYAADRCRRHGLSNVRMLHAEAGFFVRNYVPDQSLRQVHIYFPDPWPKKRHHKRRLVQAAFLTKVHDLLEAGGQIRIATDHAEYFQWMQAHADQVSQLFDVTAFESPEGVGEGELVGSNFERKYRREGRPFQAMTLKKR